MEEMTREEKKIGGLLDRIQGDKVIWMIVLLLILISIVTVFTSTPLLAKEGNTTRFAILSEHLRIVTMGLLIIIGIYAVKNIKVFQFFSQMGFGVSLFLLAFVFFKIGAVPGNPNAGWPIRAAEVNDSWRVIKFFSFQIHIFEVVKVAMVMYLAWAVNAFKEDTFTLVRLLNRKGRWNWIETSSAKKLVYLYIPIFLTALLMLNGGISSTVMYLGMMVLILIVGGVDIKEVFALLILLGLFLGLGMAVYKTTRLKIIPERLTRVSGSTRGGNINKKLREFEGLTKETEKMAYLKEKKIEQPVSALLAIKEGGIFGKGIGRSSQKYKVPVMYGDYVFSFIIEETGLWGALIIIILYISLLARGSRITKKCADYYSKCTMAGLIVMITTQAFMHMAYNVHLLPQTGQTLPLISHGASSFLCFCVAFGVILSISRQAHDEMQDDEMKAKPIIASDDDVQNGLNELDDFESDEI